MTRFGQGLTEKMGDQAPSVAPGLQSALRAPGCLVFGVVMVIICTVTYHFFKHHCLTLAITAGFYGGDDYNLITRVFHILDTFANGNRKVGV
jgi:hypothetical protein